MFLPENNPPRQCKKLYRLCSSSRSRRRATHARRNRRPEHSRCINGNRQRGPIPRDAPSRTCRGRIPGRRDGRRGCGRESGERGRRRRAGAVTAAVDVLALVEELGAALRPHVDVREGYVGYGDYVGAADDDGGAGGAVGDRAGPVAEC